MSNSPDIQKSRVIQRKLAVEYEMPYNEGTPQEILFPENDDNFKAELMLGPASLRITEKTSTELGGEPRQAVIDELDRLIKEDDFASFAAVGTVDDLLAVFEALDPSR